MANQGPNKDGWNWDSEETLISEFFSGLEGYHGSRHRLELPSIQPRLPIIRPPEGCEKMKPTEFLDIFYQDLPTPTSIRILKVLPGAKSYSDFELFRPPIKCSIVVADLNDDISYDALSYTWGDPCTLYLSPEEISPQEAWAARPFDIEVDGKPVSVGANLYAALLALRSHVTHQEDPQFSDVPQSTGCFWIDALCINQSDLKEKSSQVMMMSRIYQQARLVFAWLGGGDHLSRQALHNLLVIANLCSKGRNDPKDLRNMDIMSDDTYRRLGIPKIDYTSWIGLYLFLNRAWFKRAWIVQEVALARKPWFICGRQICNLEAILDSFVTLQQSRWLDQLRRLAEPLIQTHRTERDYPSRITLAMSHVRLYRPRATHLLNSNLGTIIGDVRISMGTSKGMARDGSTPKRPDLMRLLELYRFTESGDPRDKVYAFIGLSSEQETRPLSVDYTLKGEEVFTETTRYLLALENSLGIFSLKKNDLGALAALELPSWVPDFTVQDIRPPINQHSLFSVSKGLGEVDLSYLPNNKLQLRGAKIDSVTYLGVGFQWAAMPELSVLLQKVTPPPGQTRFEALWRTLILDYFEEDTPASKECGISFRSLLEGSILSLQLMAAVNLRYAEEMSTFRAKSEVKSGALPEGGSRFLSFGRVRERLGMMYTAAQHILDQRTKEDGMMFPPGFTDFEKRRSECKDKTEEGSVIEAFHGEVSNRLSSIKSKGDDVQFQISAKAGHGSSLFVTEKKRLGLASATLEVGDEVWVLAGGDVPLILRPVGTLGNEFRLIGEAYVHGVMQGEAVANAKEDDLRKAVLV
jgi:hypothetical protein